MSSLFIEEDWAAGLSGLYAVTAPQAVSNDEYNRLLGSKAWCVAWRETMMYWHVTCLMRIVPGHGDERRSCRFMATSRFRHDPCWTFLGPVCASGMDIIPELTKAEERVALYPDYLRR